MTTEVGYCQPDAALTQAADIMWQRDCGVVPVVDAQQKVIGMITDRDICFAAVLQNRAPGEIKIGDVISGQDKVQTCSPGDAVDDALKTMKRKQLRRLPVVNRDGVLVGILSLADLIRNAGSGKDAVPRKKLFAALKEISHLRPITLHILSPEDEENESAEKDDEENTSPESEDDAEENESEEDSNDEDSEDEEEEESDDEDEDEDDDEEKDESVSDENGQEKK